MRKRTPELFMTGEVRGGWVVGEAEEASTLAHRAATDPVSFSSESFTPQNPAVGAIFTQYV